MIVLRHYQRRSANTRRLYARELLLFLAYCESGGQDPYAVRAEHVEDYLAVLSGAGLAEASRALALAAISAYYDRAVHAGAIDANPCATVERPKPAADEQNQARALSRPQAAELLAAARTRSTLHELLVCLLFFNGLRVSDAASADVEDLDEHQGHRVLRVRGKGKTEKNHRVPLNAPTVTALGRWLHERATIADAATGPLLLSPTAGRPLTRQAIYGLISRLARSAGVGQLTPTGSEPPWSRSQPQQGRSVEGEALSGPRGPSDSWHADGLWRSSRRTLSTRRPNRRYRAQFLDSPQRGSRGLALGLVAPSAMISARNALAGSACPRWGGSGRRRRSQGCWTTAPYRCRRDHQWRRPLAPVSASSGSIRRRRPVARAHTPARSRGRSAPAR